MWHKFWFWVAIVNCIYLVGCTTNQTNVVSTNNDLDNYKLALQLLNKPNRQQQGVKIIDTLHSKGFAPASYSLATIYLGRNSVDIQRQGLTLIQQTAQQNYAPAQFSLANYYATGIRGVLDPNRQLAEQNLKLASKNKYPLALEQLADSLINNPQQIKTAIKLYRTAHQQGWASASEKLARLYYNGAPGLPIDYPQAFYYAKESAKNGILLMQYFTANCYLYGIGVKASYIQAYAWLSLALSNGLKDANNEKQALETILSPAQIMQAGKLTNKFYQRYKIIYNGNIARQYANSLFAQQFFEQLNSQSHD